MFQMSGHQLRCGPDEQTETVLVAVSVSAALSFDQAFHRMFERQLS